MIVKFVTLFICGLLCACVPEDINSGQDNNFLQYIPECSAGCMHLSSLVEEADDEIGCKQSRSVGEEECKIICAKKMAAGNKNVSPKCWTTLKSCNDFEEQCNFGELY